MASEFERLASAGDAVRPRLSIDTEDWDESPFLWLRRLNSRSKGAAGEMLAEEWLTNRARLAVSAPTSTGHDRLVEGHAVEIKLSTLWRDGWYSFQQLRDQDYEFALLLGISPSDASMWLVPKSIVLEHAEPQHGGSAGTETRWLRFRAAAPPAWMASYGGDLQRAAGVIRSVLSRR